ncbi:MAG: RsmB/NOP family class I SAM-dependent RNA methyltransferase, partial [Alphaproteobacteria bacterium]|nr:RsmB/NOP family class I SAM-dependent RNA methyltransferase [Alphaproteobacteria bacterium]
SQVYDVLRRRAALAWALGQGGVNAPAPRQMILAALLSDEMFTGEGHAPAKLDGEERALLERLKSVVGAAPDWVEANYPEWLDPQLRERFGTDTKAEMLALNQRAPVDLRVNTLKARREEVLAEFQAQGVAAEATRLSPLGIRIAAHDRIDRLPPVRDGLAEIQDEGSQLVALLVGAKAGEQIVDFCAGAGGKALALAAATGGRSGQVYALDSDGRRLERIKDRARRAGAHNIQPRVIRESGEDPWLAAEGARFHRVLVDAPCSGTGAWRRQPDARWRLTPEELAAQVARQKDILERASRLVRKGGRLIYATCSLLVAENEAVVEDFLAQHPHFVRVPLAEAWHEAIGGTPPGAGEDLLLTPHRHGTDGFYASVMRRRD